jgi:glycine cleavage system H protein
MAPASGEVIEVNDALVDNPALVNQSPHGEGWFFKIRMSTPAELDTLMDFEAYQKTVQ